MLVAKACWKREMGLVSGGDMWHLSVESGEPSGVHMEAWFSGVPLHPNESILALLLAALSNGKETSGAQVEPVLSDGSEPHVTLVRKGWFPCSRLPSPVVLS